MVDQVAAFTDTYLPTVNGVTYTVSTWQERFHRLGGQMAVVFPDGDYDPGDLEFPVRSLPFPFYDGFRLGQPTVPNGLSRPDVVHAHTPFALGLAGSRYARTQDIPLVASYHTPAAEYAGYVTPRGRLTRLLQTAATAYERWFYDRADLVIAPSRAAREHVRERVGISTPVAVVSNGVDLERFRPVPEEAGSFRAHHGLESANDRLLIGYTGRHGHEKCLEELIDAVAGFGGAVESRAVTLVLAGDGPARPALERRAAARGVDARFLGFLERSELPAFYASLDAFAFPSPVETQGLVALESIATGTPVVAVDAGALTETVEDGVTGIHYERGDLESFRDGIRAVLEHREQLAANCLERREALGVDRSIDRVRELYESLLE
ncbi:glycosyltransferase [Natronosalvus vescus]|uniref:glycosyltransferase n=1 Tax=Natronosalvus vescus TaxID=2953881 RepID=UPI002091DE29|nr:glycosyltransferase [Natronosalvus vescus]